MNNVIISSFRWLVKNFSTFFIALIFAIFVWVSAVLSADPNVQGEYSQPLEIKIIGLDANLVIVNNIPKSVQMTLKAPRSIWEQLNARPELIQVWIDLTGLSTGEYLIPVKSKIDQTPNQIVRVDPEEIQVVLEPLIVKTEPVQIITIGEPAMGYRKGSTQSEPREVTLSGPESLVTNVVRVVAEVDIDGANDSIRMPLSLKPVDENGEVVQGVTLTPQIITLSQEITLLGGYRNVVVKVVTEGQVENGYWLTNISVTPPNVTVFSTNPEIINTLPGYVETETVDLAGLSDDIDVRVNLNLIEGVELAGEESVLVRLSVAALEGSLPITLPVVDVGLPPELTALLSPDQVELLIVGPLPILNNLKPGGIRVSVDLTGLGPGKYQIKPIVDLLPNQVQVASILPESVEVVISWTTSAQLTATPVQIITNTPIP